MDSSHAEIPTQWIYQELARFIREGTALDGWRREIGPKMLARRQCDQGSFTILRQHMFRQNSQIGLFQIQIEKFPTLPTALIPCALRDRQKI